MKFYETHYEEYINSMNRYNLHEELVEETNKYPNEVCNFGNMIIYGPQGSGKYTQVLNIIKKYSNNDLKHDKKITCQTEKHQYTYHISDIHYEIDMSLLGCNSKILWHEIFFQIIDIISIKPEKIGIILCKNFHSIHAELLETFYSYMRHCNNSQSIIQIHFILMTEQLSFIPNNIINNCKIVNINRPLKAKYLNIITENNTDTEELKTFTQRITDIKQITTKKDNIMKICNLVESDGILNLKELRSFSLIDDSENIPSDIFNIICDKIIKEIVNYEKIVFTEFRDIIYDILIYNLDIADCLWYILNYLIKNNCLSSFDISCVMQKIFIFMKYYNNNYRPIYHLESILFYIIIRVHKIKNEL